MTRHKIPVVLMAALMACTSLPSSAQGTADDYNRAYSLREKYSQSHVLYADVEPHWIEYTDSFWYVRNTERGREYALVDARGARRTDLFNHERLAERLSAMSGKKVEPYRIYINKVRTDRTAENLRFEFDGRRWAYNTKENTLTKEGNVHAPAPQRHWMEVDDEKSGGPVTSPDGRYVAFVRDDNVWVRNSSGGGERQLSIDGTQGNYYSTYIQWSPDSRRVMACRIRPAAKRYVYYVESSPADQLQPVLHKQEYAKPGDELRFKVPCIFEVETGRALIPSTELFANQYDLHSMRWNADSKGLTFEYNERGHKVYRLLEMSATDGSVRTLIGEKEEKYVNYPRIFRHLLADGRRIIWSSERDNYNHLYMYDRATGKPTRQITKGRWYVREVQHVDEQNGVIYFSANGVNKDEDPYFIHYYRINFDGSGMKELTPEEGMHRCWYSSDHKYMVDVYSTPQQAPVALVRSADTGKTVMPLEKADISALLANGWTAPETFKAKGRDGKTDMWGIIYRPSDFDPQKKYPIVEYIYSGPGDQYVPKTFASYNWWMTSLAELGFIVVQVDGMTTSFRSKEFEEVCYKNLKDAGLPDHMAWITAAAERYPSMDTTRVGIFGSSAGGQEAMAAVLFHPEFYKAAYSACGCHDNRMDKIWWNELWMGYPVDEAYSRNSNVDNAHLLTRPLMLVVGEMDDNVDPASTMQVADALIKAGKNFELVVLPGVRHTMGEDFGEHKRYDFFVRHLMGVEPPSWDKIVRK